MATIKVLLCWKDLLGILNLKSRRSSVTIAFNREITNDVLVSEGLKVSKRQNKSNKWLKLSTIFTKPSLPVDKNNIATPLKQKKS